MSSPVSVTVVVVTWQGCHLLRPCLNSLRRQSLAHRVIVVDNGSTDGTRELLAAYSDVEVVWLSRNTGFAGGVSAALPLVQSRFLALLNNDAEAKPSWLEAATDCLRANPGVAAVSSRMLLPGHPVRVNNTGIVLERNGYGADRGLGDLEGAEHMGPAEVFGASAGAAVYRTLAVKAVGGVEPRYFMYYEDTDLAWRLQLAGWRAVYCPSAVVRHRHAASSEPGSAAFAFYTERNRLLTLAREAPAWFTTVQLCRFTVTTVSLAVKRLFGARLPDNAVFSPQTRLHALWSAARLGPSLRAARGSTTSQQRARVLARWRGQPARPWPSKPSTSA